VGEISARKGQEMGWLPPPLGHPPSLLLLYKSPFSHCFYAPQAFRILSLQAALDFQFPARVYERKERVEREKRKEGSRLECS
jgi:hypothetical protein